MGTLPQSLLLRHFSASLGTHITGHLTPGLQSPRWVESARDFPYLERRPQSTLPDSLGPKFWGTVTLAARRGHPGALYSNRAP